MLRKRSAEISISELSVTLLPCFTNIAVIFFIVDFTNMFDNRTQGFSENILIVFITGMLFLSSASLLLIFEKYLRNKEKQRKSELMEQQTKDLLKFFSEKEIADERIKKMYHDIKNHILCLERMALDSNNGKDYIAAIKDTLSDYENYIATGNRALDILINEKNIKMRHLNIKFSCTINLMGIDFIKDIDFITIFSNAIDNAIEACEKADENQRYIKMNSTYAGQFLTIKICNYISGNIKFEGHTIQTSKADPFYHGIGLENIKKSVSKYKGEVNFDITRDDFKMIIVIPMKEKPGSQNG
jgi:sensor histidine kinase YesM